MRRRAEAGLSCLLPACLQVQATWKLNAPFSISPASSSVAPGASAHATVSFLPQEAGSFVANATLQLDNGTSCTCKVLSMLEALAVE